MAERIGISFDKKNGQRVRVIKVQEKDICYLSTDEGVVFGQVGQVTRFEGNVLNFTFKGLDGTIYLGIPETAFVVEGDFSPFPREI